MCMICKYCCYNNDGTIECEAEDEDGNIYPNLLKNFDCSVFEFSPIYLIEVLVHIVEEMNNTGKPKDKNSISYIQNEKNAYTLLYSRDWYIWGISGTANKEENRRNDILLIYKESKKEYRILNWKRCQRILGKTKHIWHYEIYSDNELTQDGEYVGKDYRDGSQKKLIDYILKQIKIG